MTLVSSIDEHSSEFKSLAVAIVLLMHIAFYQIVSYNERAAFKTIPEDGGIRIQYIKSVRGPTTRAPSVHDNQSASEEKRSHLRKVGNELGKTTRQDNRPAQTTAVTSVQGVPTYSDRPLMLEWADNNKIEPDYQRDILGDRIPVSLAKSEQDRFRMRKQISGKDVIEGTAQFLGLWPPGYTTDPCPKIERNIGGLIGDARSAARELLDEELRRQKTHCR